MATNHHFSSLLTACHNARPFKAITITKRRRLTILTPNIPDLGIAK